MYVIRSWALQLARNLERMVQTILCQDWRNKSLVTQSFNHCFGYVICIIFFVCGLIPFLNAFHPSIKFTMNYSPYQINYLDVSVTKDESGKTLRTNLYTKPISPHQYLHAQSCHRAVYKKSRPYSYAVQIKLICSEEEDFAT